MAFSRPPLPEILSRVLDDIETELAGVNARLRRSIERAVGVATAGASHLLHGHLSAIEKMLNWSTATGDYLFSIASLFGVNRLQPTQAHITYQFSGTPSTSIAAGTEVAISGVTFTTDAIASVGVGGTVDVAMTANDAGTDGNVEAGTTGYLSTPIAGVDSAGEVVSLDIEARDLEVEDDTRDRFHERLRTPPTGGGPGDYERWAEETPTVSVGKAWEFPLFLGGGTVGVLFAKPQDLTADGGDGTSVIPTSPEVADVLAYVQSKAPVNAYVYVYAPIADPINPTIQLPAGTATSVQDAIEASLHDLLDPDNGTGPGSVPGGTSVTVLISRFREAISQAPGETDHVLVYPTADIESEFGKLPVLGTINWQVMP